HQESRLLFVKEAKQLARKEFLKWFHLTYDVNPLLKYFKETEMQNPTLYVMGSEDHMFLPTVRKMIADFERSELCVIPDCGHVCNIEKPDEFNEHSLEFLKRQALRTTKAHAKSDAERETV
ncbi:MAG: hypothetical protein EBR93_04500, partial [Bacteroidetes bacterium]|nr:hypothetical protein [Bacteroidota bacterium]